METLHPLLGTNKRNPFLEVLISPENPKNIFVYYGLHLLEVVRRGKDRIEEKLLTGRLYNAGFRRSALTSAFQLSRKTIAKIGGALKSGNSDRLHKALCGRRKKIPPEIEYYIRRKIREVYSEQGCHTNKFIRADLLDKFQLPTNKESVRVILNDELQKMGIVKQTTFSRNGKLPIKEMASENSEPHLARSFSTKKIVAEKVSATSSDNAGKPSPPGQNVTVPKTSLNCQNTISARGETAKNDNLSPAENAGSSSENREETDFAEAPDGPSFHHKNSIDESKMEEPEDESPSSRKSNGPAIKSHGETPPGTRPEQVTGGGSDSVFGPPVNTAGPVFLPPLPGPENCHHLGILLFRELIDELTDDLGACRDLVRQWLACVLLGAVNIEQCDDINYDTLEYLIGTQLVALRHQRTALTRFATEENITELFRRNAVFIGADGHIFFLYDPHGVSYTGKLNILKCWLGSKGKVGKGYYLDFVHTVDGEPVMIFHDDNYYDLRERFLGNIDQLRNVLSGDRERKLYIIVDRAIYDLEDMRAFREKNVYVITWEKGYVKGQWDKVSAAAAPPFYLKKYKNSSKKELIYKIEYVKLPWHRDGTFAKYIVRITKPVEIAEKPIEVPVLCPDPDLPPEQALTPILNRWLQEEDFLYGGRNFGINEITSYKYNSYLKIVDLVNDKLMENRKYTKLCAKRLQLRKKLGLEVLRKQEFNEKNGPELETLNREVAALETRIDKFEKANDTGKVKGLKKEKRAFEKKLVYINAKQKRFDRSHAKVTGKLKEQIGSLDEQIDIEPKRISRIEHLLKNEFMKLNFMPKAFMDAVKIMARNIFYERHKIYRPLRDDFRRDHVVVRSVSRAHGFIREKPDALEVMLEPTRRLDKTTKKAVQEFMRIIAQSIKEKYKSMKKIRFLIYKNRCFGNSCKTRRTNKKWWKT